MVKKVTAPDSLKEKVNLYQVSREPHNALRRDLHRYVGKDLWIPMILVLFAYCIAGGCPRRKIRKSSVRSLMEQPTQFSATPLSAQGSYGDEYQACSSRVLQLAHSAENLTPYLRGSFSVYERLIIAGVRILIVSSIWVPV